MFAAYLALCCSIPSTPSRHLLYGGNEVGRNCSPVTACHCLDSYSVDCFLQGCRPLVKSSSASWTVPAEPVVLLNFGPDPSSPALSCIVINTVVAAQQQVSLAHEVASLLPLGSTVAVLAAIKVQHHPSGRTTKSLHAAALGSLQSLPSGVTELPLLDGSTRINDGLVAALLHFLTASQHQAFILLFPGAHKMSPLPSRQPLPPLFPWIVSLQCTTNTSCAM